MTHHVKTEYVELSDGGVSSALYVQEAITEMIKDLHSNWHVQITITPVNISWVNEGADTQGSYSYNMKDTGVIITIMWNDEARP